MTPKPDARIAPTADEFESWCAHPTTRFVAAAFEAAALEGPSAMTPSKPVTLQDEAYQRTLYDRTRALKRLRKGIEALFASAREAEPNERTAYIEIGGERYVYVVFANGAVKPEGIDPRPATSLGQSVTSTIKAVAEYYPDHATQQMIWRCAPSYEVGDGVEFELDREGKPIRETLSIRQTPWFLRARLLAMPLSAPGMAQ